MATSSSTSTTLPIPGIHRDPSAVYGRPQPCEPQSILKRNGNSIEFPQTRSLSPPRIHYDEKRVTIEWDDTTRSKLYVMSISFSPCVVFFFPWVLLNQAFFSHNIWLRDHCRCSECFHAITKQRLAETFDVSINYITSRSDFGQGSKLNSRY